MLGMPAQHSGLRSRWLSWRLSGRRRLPSLRRFCHLCSIFGQRRTVQLKLATHGGTSPTSIDNFGHCMRDVHCKAPMLCLHEARRDLHYEGKVAAA